MINTQSRFSLTARWVFPISHPPLERGVIEIDSGRIVGIHNRHDPQAVDLGNTAIIPGLINAHTHLEFSDLAQPVQPALPFTEWIRSLVSVRRAKPATRDVIQQGLAECDSSGSVAVGEIATQDWANDVYQQAEIAVTVFRELIGLLPDRAAMQLETARNWLTQPTSSNTPVTRGLSPHAPYSVHPDLYRDLVQLAAKHHAPLAIHLAETPAELELLSQGTGEFVEMLKRFNAWDDHAISRGSRPLDYLNPLESLPRALVIHGNYLGTEDFDRLEKLPQVSVVYCPRTHHFFQHPPHPWLELIRRGINVALGTDSRGSNPDLSLWNELRFLAERYPQVDPSQILFLGTLAGARALGHETNLGSLEPGKQAAFAVVPLPPATGNDPYQTLFSSAQVASFRNITLGP